jgi:hypothetical protein
MDFNVNPMAAMIFWHHKGHMHFFQEIELKNADTQYMCDFLRDRYAGGLRDVFPDASGVRRSTNAPEGQSDFWFLRKEQYVIRAHAKNPHRKDRYNSVNGKLAPKNGAPTISISSECKNLIKYLMVYSHEDMNKQQNMSHLLDAFSYPIAYLYPVVKEEITTHRLRGF